MSTFAMVTVEAFLGDRMASLRDSAEAIQHLFSKFQASSVFEIDQAALDKAPIRGMWTPKREWGALVVAFAGETNRDLAQFFEDLGAAESVINTGAERVDVDLIFFGHEIRMTPPLTLPHPDFHRRPFLLIPATEIAPHFKHPVLGQSILDLAAPFLNDRWGRYFARGHTLFERTVTT